ncbi:uncharacterized protein LOC106872293 [Octopus bimaculoides]|uniref:uncharacterized protein LOC106872293 n=1 Tax=Octopus bimaculoides TaxID=37653 RepID=UPI0022DEC006|nr:uncharacterized protein LOC106872293 [Octopus bimaculoides]
MGLKLFFLLLSLTGTITLSKTQIPKSERQKVNKLTSLKDLQEFLHVNDGDFQYASTSEIVNADYCSPRLTTIEIPQPTEYNKYYWPKCTRVKRCGGCAEHESLACVPTTKGKVFKKVQVVRLNYDYYGAPSLTLDRVVGIDLETHTDCEQVCKVTEDDCDDKIHIYSSADCSCRCKPSLNTRCTHPKTWNKKTCRCTCPKLKACGHGLYFNKILCTCQHYRGYDGTNFASANASFVKQSEISKSGSNQLDSNRINSDGKPQTDLAKTDAAITNNQSTDDLDKGSSLMEILSTEGLRTTTMPTTIETTTEKKTTLKITKPSKAANICASKKCPPRWMPVLQRNGLCGCKPNFG